MASRILYPEHLACRNPVEIPIIRGWSKVYHACPMECICNLYSIGVKPVCIFLFNCGVNLSALENPVIEVPLKAEIKPSKLHLPDSRCSILDIG